MHPYVSEARNRGIMYTAFVLASLASAWGVKAAIAASGIQLPWWVEAPSVLGFYGLYWKAFDLWLWKTPLARRLGWSTAPNLAGTWEAEVTTTYSGASKQARGIATVHQTSSRIRISIRWEQSKSYSVAGVIQSSPVGVPEFIYQYLNMPDALAPPTMHTHRGTAWLEFRSPNELNGEYFTGRDRQQWGHIRLIRTSFKVESTAFP